MQEHIYKLKPRRALFQSSFILLYILLQVFLNIYGILTYQRDLLFWVFINLFICIITVPATLLFIKYYRRSSNKEFIVRYNTLAFRDTISGETAEMKNEEIVKIILVETKSSRLPWAFHEYFKIIDIHGKEIVVTSFIMDIGEFRTDSLTGRVSGKIERQYKIYPIF